ncbi:hypothetical protein LTR17_009231 [Elasticomyces elasticus]|nr:hypothetical protein LTR17_009231 [Elasticomyces elasticus]
MPNKRPPATRKRGTAGRQRRSKDSQHCREEQAEIARLGIKDTRRYFICVKCRIPQANPSGQSGVDHDECYCCEMWASNDNCENQIKWRLRGDRPVSCIVFWRDDHDDHDDEVEDCLECREYAAGAASSKKASKSADENT